MSEYIKREDVLDAVLFALVGTGHQSRAIWAIRDVNTADVVEVRHGKWELEHETYGKMRCSHCKHNCPTERKPDTYEDFQMTDFYVDSPYCPNCGAKMDGERSENGKS